MMKLKLYFIAILSLGIISCQLSGVRCQLFAQDSSKEEEALFIAEKAFEDGFFDVALGLFERFLKNYPASSKAAKVNLLIGQCYFHQNKFLDALSKLEGLLSLPQAKDIQDEVLYWIAEVHFRGNDFTKAATYYKKIIDEFPKSSYLVACYYSLGWCLFQGEDYAQALEYFKIVEEKFPQEALAQDSSSKIIECLYNLKDYNSLKDRLTRYIKASSKDALRLSYLHFYLAEAYYYLNDFLEASNEYSKVLPDASDEKIYILSRLGLGWSYLKLKRYPQAEEVLFALKTEGLEKKSLDILLLGKAILRFETNKFIEAKDIYNEVLSATLDPLVLIQAYLGKADALYNMGEYKEAITVYGEGLKRLAESHQGEVPQEIIDKLHYGLSWAYLKEGEFKEAIEEFQKVAKHSEDKVVKIAALCQIGDAYQDSQDYDKAIQAYDNILKDYPDNLYSDYVQYQLGLALLKKSNYDGAIMSFLSLKKNFPNSKMLDESSYALGLAYFQREDYNSSQEIFAKFPDEFKESPFKPQAMYLLGTSLYNLGQYAQAIEVFKDIIRIYAQDIELIQKAEYEIADCYYQLGNEKEAMLRFQVLRSKYPDSRLTPEVVWWLGEYYYRHNKLDLARRYFSSLIQDFPNSDLIPSCYYALGSIYLEDSNYEEAMNNFNHVIELGKSDLAGTAGIVVADIYIKQDKFDLALERYKKVIADYPNLGNLVYPKIADLYWQTKSFKEAAEFYSKSLELVPVRQMPDIQFKLAEVLEAGGNTEEAIENYLKVTYLYPEDNVLVVKSLLRVAAIYEDKDNFKEALNIYNRIASMDAQEAKYAKERIDWIKTNTR